MKRVSLLLSVVAVVLMSFTPKAPKSPTYTEYSKAVSTVIEARKDMIVQKAHFTVEQWNIFTYDVSKGINTLNVSQLEIDRLKNSADKIVSGFIVIDQFNDFKLYPENALMNKTCDQYCIDSYNLCILSWCGPDKSTVSFAMCVLYHERDCGWAYDMCMTGCNPS